MVFYLFNNCFIRTLYNGDKMKDCSIWLTNIVKDKYMSLTKDIECDTLIIGGGITGLSCAYFMQPTSQKIILVESNKIAFGATSKSTGKLTYLQEAYLNKIENVYNTDVALKYIDSQKYAINLAKKIIIDNNIKCDFETSSSYIFNTDMLNTFKIFDLYRLLKINSNVKIKNKLPINLACIKAIEANDTYVFNPVKYVLELAKLLKKNIDIFENTRITKLSNNNGYWYASTGKNKIKAKNIILACHYPFFIIPYLFPLKTTIEKSFLVASEVEKHKKFSAINIDKNLLSIRFYNNKKKYIITVTNNDKLHKNIDDLNKRNNAIWNTKTNFSTNIKYCWSNHDIMTSDYLPLIGKIKNNLYLATGYNTWGMTNGILAGKIISDLISNQKNEYSSLFDPLRNFCNVPKLITNNVTNGISFIDSKINKNKFFYDEKVKIITENGIRYGIYIDENRKEHKVLNLCPHMKCSLYFNYQTKTWDCPCHGSSFDVDGNVIYGPANCDIKKNSK